MPVKVLLLLQDVLVFPVGIRPFTHLLETLVGTGLDLPPLASTALSSFRLRGSRMFLPSLPLQEAVLQDAPDA